MIRKMDKRDRAAVFRDRLTVAMDRAGLSRSALSREAGVDRSTIAQLLAEDSARLPNAGLAADAAAALGVSTDWLLGLTDRPERPGDIVAAAMAVSPAERSSADAQLLDWHREAAGYKLRHVPATLPDMLKTDAMVAWEYRSIGDAHSERAIAALHDQVEWLRSGVSDMEIAAPLHEFVALAEGTAYYAGLGVAERHEQLRHLADICDEMYPRLRLFLYDAHRVFSAPVTVFGPRLAVIYVGQFYLAFRESERVRSMTAHFDWLVREASVDARDAAGYLRGLLQVE